MSENQARLSTNSVIMQMVQILRLMKETKATPESLQKAMGMNHTQYFKRLRDLRELGASWVMDEGAYKLVNTGVFRV